MTSIKELAVSFIPPRTAGGSTVHHARAAAHNRLPFADVVNEFEAARRSNLWLFRNLPEAAWVRAGEANNNRVSVRALAYIIVGHARHHTAILQKRLK